MVDFIAYGHTIARAYFKGISDPHTLFSGHIEQELSLKRQTPALKLYSRFGNGTVFSGKVKERKTKRTVGDLGLLQTTNLKTYMCAFWGCL